MIIIPRYWKSFLEPLPTNMLVGRSYEHVWSDMLVGVFPGTIPQTYPETFSGVP